MPASIQTYQAIYHKHIGISETSFKTQHAVHKKSLNINIYIAPKRHYHKKYGKLKIKIEH